MRIERRYTKDGQSPYADIAFRLTTSEIRNPDGSVVFQRRDVEVPEFWSQVASDVLAQKYFRKAGVPARLKKVEEETVPSLLWRSVADDEALRSCPRTSASSASIGQAGVRPARRHLDLLGLEGRLFRPRGRRAGLLRRASLHARHADGAPNSPQWFNTGLHWAYGIDGPSQGHHYVDFQTGKLTKSKIAYEHPQPHACFIQSIDDDLVNEGGIMDLWVREARLFKYGSGTGTNFSAAARRGRAARRRRQVVRPDELPQDRRPRRGRDQVGRHHAPRGQDGDRRHRPSRHRAVHRLEGDRGAEGRGAGHRLQDQPEAPEGDPEGLRELRGLGRRLLPAREEPRAQARDQARAAAATCRTTTSSA